MQKPHAPKICLPAGNPAKPEPRNGRFARRVRQFGRDKSGSYVIIAALAMPALVGGAGIGTEAGFWMYQQQKMQDAADSAAFAAATYYGPNPTSTGVSNQASSVTTAYGFSPNGTGGSTIRVSEPAADGPRAGAIGTVEVKVSRSYPRMLSAIFGRTPVTIAARAVASTKGGYGCVLALDKTAAISAQAQGTIKVELKSCSLYDDSNNANAVSGGGSAILTALSVGIVGGITGASNFSATEGIWTGQPSTPDPYADVNVPAFSGCDYKNYNNKKSETINPGVYCNGITFNGGLTVHMNDGVYIIDGAGNNGNGQNLQVNGGAIVTGNHVTIVFTSNTGRYYPGASINGGAVMTLGPCNTTYCGSDKHYTSNMSGILMYADRNTPVGTNFQLNGGSGQVLGGAVYVPTGALSYGGGNDTSTVCTQLIGDTVSFNANAVLAVNCVGMGVRMWGTGAKLAE